MNAFVMSQRPATGAAAIIGAETLAAALFGEPDEELDLTGITAF